MYLEEGQPVGELGTGPPWTSEAPLLTPGVQMLCTDSWTRQLLRGSPLTRPRSQAWKSGPCCLWPTPDSGCARLGAGELCPLGICAHWGTGTFLKARLPGASVPPRTTVRPCPCLTTASLSHVAAITHHSSISAFLPFGASVSPHISEEGTV
jgi:hypothetical protein